MTAYYNEIDPRAAAWLRELIFCGLIADGEVDERSIEDVKPSDLAGFAQCHFFAGIGGWSLALRMAGVPEDAQVWTGSCPCQPFSAGGKGAGFADERHLWPSFFHLIRSVKPQRVFGEQVAANLAWLDLVHSDLEAQNYAFGAAVLGAHSARFNHVRQRLYWVAQNAYADSLRRERHRTAAHRTERPEFERLVQSALQGAIPSGKYSLRDDGVPNRVALVRGYGNAIVPQVAKAFIEASQGWTDVLT